MTVFTEMYISAAISAVLSIRERWPEHLLLALAEPFDDHRRPLARHGLRGRADGHRGTLQTGLEQVPVGAGQVGIVSQHRPDPGLLQGERQPELFWLAEPQGVLQRLTAARGVTGLVAEPGIDQPSLQAYLLRRRTGIVRDGIERAPGGLMIACGQPHLSERDRGVLRGRRTGALQGGQGGPGVSLSRVRPRFEEGQPVFQPARG